MGSRIWLWPNLLSLDAPLVALLWQILFIRCFHAGGPASSSVLTSALLVSVVWLIYAADRALDAWRGSGLRPRHEFYRRHWRTVLPVWIVVLGATAWLAWTSLPRELFERGGALFAARIAAAKPRWAARRSRRRRRSRPASRSRRLQSLRSTKLR